LFCWDWVELGLGWVWLGMKDWFGGSGFGLVWVGLVWFCVRCVGLGWVWRRLCFCSGVEIGLSVGWVEFVGIVGWLVGFGLGWFGLGVVLFCCHVCLLSRVQTPVYTVLTARLAVGAASTVAFTTRRAL
jgi:hypothetical protein